MKIVFALILTLLFAFASPNISNAVTFVGTATGSFSDVISTDSSDVYSLSSHDAGGVAAFNWGEFGSPGTTSFDNQFTFDGIGSDGDPGWSIESESAFLIGNFSYRNGSTTNSAGIDGVSLNIALQITDPLNVTGSYLFEFNITNTPNDTGNPVSDGDTVTVAGLYSTTTFVYGITEYTLQLLGFSSDFGATIRTDFSSPEGTRAYAGLFARITSDIPNQVPEPATMLLFGLGLVSLLLGIKRTFKK